MTLFWKIIASSTNRTIKLLAVVGYCWLMLVVVSCCWLLVVGKCCLIS